MLTHLRWLTHKRQPLTSHFPRFSRDSNLAGQAGFTMIEMLVAVGIMLVLVGGGIASFITFNDKQQLQASTKLMQTYMRAAQTKARVGDRPPGCTRLDGYSVQVAEGTNTVELVANCSPSDISIQGFDLAGVETVTVNDGQVDVLYQVLHGGAQNVGEVEITSTAGSIESFTVSAGGDIGQTTKDWVPEALQLNTGNNSSTDDDSVPHCGDNVCSESYAEDPQTCPEDCSTTQDDSESSPTPTPTPTPNVDTTAILFNQRTDMSCTEFCIENGFAACSSIGLNSDGTDGKYRRRKDGSCKNKNGSCLTVMKNQGKCNGTTYYTNCICTQ
jgi:prepilin-type N-terminal cleavage/methylation domain-containing protein